jgi:hypothetical protein
MKILHIQQTMNVLNIIVMQWISHCHKLKNQNHILFHITITLNSIRAVCHNKISVCVNIDSGDTVLHVFIWNNLNKKYWMNVCHLSYWMNLMQLEVRETESLPNVYWKCKFDSVCRCQVVLTHMASSYFMPL